MRAPPRTAGDNGWMFVCAASFVILKIVGLFIGLRVSEGEELRGLDQSVHGEEAYDLGLEPALAPATMSEASELSGGAEDFANVYAGEVALEGTAGD